MATNLVLRRHLRLPNPGSPVRGAWQRRGGSYRLNQLRIWRFWHGIAVDLQEKRKLDLEKQAASVKAPARPWRAIIFTVLAVAAAGASFLTDEGSVRRLGQVEGTKGSRDSGAGRPS